MATQSVRIGWRPYVNLTSVQAAAYLLDSYSGAAAAYSLRKLKSSYTGSAIRVRRSSDNTELNIGFDSDGNLDTVALSAFVGTGNGFVTTWYDQSGNTNLDAVQPSAVNQPYIVQSGVLCTLNGKAIIRNPNANVIRCLITPISSAQTRPISIIASGKIYSLPLNGYGNVGFYLGGTVNAGAGSTYAFSVTPSSFGTQIRYGSTTVNTINTYNTFSSFIHQGHFASSVLTSRINGIDATTTITDSAPFASNSNFTLISANAVTTDFIPNIGMYEYIFYFSDKTSDRAGIESNINSYYSIYPNPTSVWNLLAAAYSADTTASSSLKTSLFAAYNGESNTNDSFGTNNGTAVGGLTYSTGKIGNAFVFNGSNSYVSLPNNSLNSLTSDFSVSGWLYMPANTSNLYCVLLSNVSNDYTTGKGWSIFTYGNNIYFDVYYSGVYQNPNSVYVRLQANNTLTNNAWNHIAIARKNSTSSKIYINGSLVGSNTSTQNPATPTAAITPTIGVLSSVGVGNPLSSYAPNGTKIDALSVWNKELTASEVSELYNSGNGAQYITDNFYKPTTNDALGTNNGTAVGGLTYGLGKVGTAFVGNGTNAYVSLPNTSGQFNFAGDFSVSMWFRSSNLSTSRYAVGNYKAGGSYGYGWVLYYTGSGGFAFDVRNNNNINQVAKLLPLLTNTWYHVVAVRKMGQIHKLYVNGVDQLAPQTDGNVNNIAAYTANQPMNICGIDLFPALCDLDGVNMWNRTLTQSEVTELYNSGNGKQYPN